MSILAFNFRLLPLSPAFDAVDDAIVEAVEDCPDFALSTVLRSLDSTLRVLPVESLVMVTEPPDEEGAAVVANVETDADTELVFVVMMGSLDAEDILVDEAGSLTGEMVTLVSFLLGEEEPKSRPSSSSTLSKADSLASVSSTDFCLEPPMPLS